MIRSGIGYDMHRLEEGRRLILGGVEVPFEKGLAGHSDADVLVHAIIDSLLGAMGKGDMGIYFPDSDDRFKGISSLKLLEEVRLTLEKSDFGVQNIDSVIVAQAPKLRPFMEAMRREISKTLNVEEDRINIKAKTPEGMDSIGRGEAVSAQAVCILSRKEEKRSE